MCVCDKPGMKIERQGNEFSRFKLEWPLPFDHAVRLLQGFWPNSFTNHFGSLQISGWTCPLPPRASLMDLVRLRLFSVFAVFAFPRGGEPEYRLERGASPVGQHDAAGHGGLAESGRMRGVGLSHVMRTRSAVLASMSEWNP